jgi:Fe-S oxidoreductase/nitrate reductase gamma subunit
MTAASMVVLGILVAAVAVFGWGLTRNFRLVARGRRPAADQVGKGALGNVLSLAGLHSRLLADLPAGFMHLALFFGFLLLLPQNVTIVLRLFSPDKTVFSAWPGLEALYTLLKECAELAVLVALGLAWFRRWFLKPARLLNNLSANVLLLLIGAIVLWDLATDTMLFVSGALPHLEDDSFLASTFAGMVLALKVHRDNAATLVAPLASLTVLSLAALFVAIPFSKHFHLVSAGLRAAVARLGVSRPLEAISLEDDRASGLDSVTTFNSLQVLDLLACTECGRCTDACPSAAAGSPLSPRNLTMAQRDAAKCSQGLVGASGEEALLACSTCAACEQACPVGIEQVGRVVQLRRYLTMKAGRSTPGWLAALQSLRSRGNPFELTLAARADLARATGLPVFADTATDLPDTCLFLGCAAARDQASREAALAAVQLLRAAGVTCGVLAQEEGCCGDHARRLGDEALFLDCATRTVETFKRYGLKRVLTLCPHCCNVLKNEYAALGLSAQVLHYTEVLPVPDQALAPSPEWAGLRVALHDPCYLTRYNGLQQTLRDQLTGAGLLPVELPHNGQDTLCCGGGGGLYFGDEPGKGMASRRMLEAVELGVDLLVTACPYCKSMLEGAGQSRLFSGLRVPVVRDLAQVLGRQDSKGEQS